MIECTPADSPAVVYVATPEPFNVVVPRIVEPSMNVASPVGVFVPLGFTVAVKVTDEPEVMELALLLKVVFVDAGNTRYR